MNAGHDFSQLGKDMEWGCGRQSGADERFLTAKSVSGWEMGGG